MDFIPCEHREGDQCNHGRVHAPAVTPAWCERCLWRLLPNDGQRARPIPTSVEAVRPSLAPARRRSPEEEFPCSLRGEVRRLVSCSSCAFQKKLKVYACELHGECSFTAGPGVKVCDDSCSDRRPPVDSPAIT
jgi:hypothetical protein